MNRRQIEIQKIHAANEEYVIKQLKQVYMRARRDCGKKIRELSSRTDMENLQSIVFQKQYQEMLIGQINGILETLNNNSFTTIADYLALSYEDGFLGTLYDLQGQGIPLIFPIDQEEVIIALQVDSKISRGLYSRMGEDTDKLKIAVRDELSRGTARGENWNQIAARIADGMNSPFNRAFNRAITIVRTEGHRVCQESAYHCQQRAKSKGADIVKQWCSTLDGVTRPNHVELDNQVRELDEPFEVAGKKAMYPGAFGDPSEDCNCRCCLNQRARWRLSEEEFITKWDGDKKELVKVQAKNFEDFKEQYSHSLEDAEISDYVSSKKHYEKQVQKLRQLEAEEDSLMDAYMDAMDTPKATELEQAFNEKFEEVESFKQVVKDLRAALSGKETKAVRHVEKSLALKTGMSLDNIKMTGLEYDTANMVYSSYKTVLNKYPELKGNLVAFEYDGVKGDAYAGCFAMRGEIKAHAIFAKYDSLVKAYADDVAAGFHPVGTDHNSIIVHELGHALDGYMTKQGLLGGAVSTGGIRSSVDVQRQVLEQLGWDSEHIRGLRESLKAQGFTHFQIVDKINEERKAFITKQISEYAADNEKELFAECFAEYVMSDNPRKAAQIFGEIIDDALGR